MLSEYATALLHLSVEHTCGVCLCACSFTKLDGSRCKRTGRISNEDFTYARILPPDVTRSVASGASEVDGMASSEDEAIRAVFVRLILL